MPRAETKDPRLIRALAAAAVLLCGCSTRALAEELM
jgi:hypothetical protein